jgi:hypothetical protein
MKRFGFFRLRRSLVLGNRDATLGSFFVLNVLWLQSGTALAQAKEAAVEPSVTGITPSTSVVPSTEAPATAPNETEVAQPTVTRPNAPMSDSVAVQVPVATSPLPPPVKENCSCPCNSSKSGPLEAPIDPFQRKRGYGWQLAVADAANLSVHLVAGFANDKKWIDGPIPYTFIGTYVLSGPIVHLANGRLSQAGKSLGVRMVTPLVFGLLGSLVSTSEKAVAGTILTGMAAGAVFDAWVLGRGDYVGVQTSRRGLTLSPWLHRDNRAVGAQMTWVY